MNLHKIRTRDPDVDDALKYGQAHWPDYDFQIHPDGQGVWYLPSDGNRTRLDSYYMRRYAQRWRDGDR